MNTKEHQPPGDHKLHYKMYKAGKHWLFAAITAAALGVGGGQLLHPQAATEEQPVAATVQEDTGEQKPTEDAERAAPAAGIVQTATETATEQAPPVEVATPDAETTTLPGATDSEVPATDTDEASTSKDTDEETTPVGAPKTEMAKGPATQHKKDATKDDEVEVGRVTVDKDNFGEYFTVSGNAKYNQQEGIVTLTPEKEHQNGNVTLKNKISPDQDFTLTGEINLGSNNQPSGADGISFGFHKGETTAIGHDGGGLGFAGLPDAIGWKADTYWNKKGTGDDEGYFDQDPSQFNKDSKNGQGKGKPFGAFVRTEKIGGKYKALVVNPNEDEDEPSAPKEITKPSKVKEKGGFKEITIDYNAGKQTLTVNYDDEVWEEDVSSYLKDHDSLAFFIAGATGDGVNLQQFKIDKFTYSATGVVQVEFINDVDHSTLDHMELSGPVYSTDTIGNQITERSADITRDGKLVQTEIKQGTGTQYDPATGKLTYTTTPGKIEVHFNAAPTQQDCTVTKTVHYHDEAGNQIYPDYTTTTIFHTITDLGTGNVTYYGDRTLDYQDNPVLEGYTLVDNPIEATSTQTVVKGDNGKNFEYTVTYRKNAPTVTTSTVTKTVHYVNEGNETMHPDFVDTVTFTHSEDAVSHEVTVTWDKPVFGHQDNPTHEGYTVKISPPNATKDQDVTADAKDVEYTVVYAKNPPTITKSTVTKTVHYVNEGNETVHPDFVDTVTFTNSEDAVTHEVSVTWDKPVFGHQKNPSPEGYTVKTSPFEATEDQKVTADAKDVEYTVIYAKNPPTITTTTVTKTVHYVDEAGNKLYDSFTDTVTFTSSKDAVTGAVTTTQDKPVFGRQDNPDIKGYTIKTSPEGATTEQTVKFGDSNLEYTVVYELIPPVVTTNQVTHTLHYVDVYGNTVAPDHTDTVTFTTTVDGFGNTTYEQDKDVYTHPAHPNIADHHIAIDPLANGLELTAHHDDTDSEATVVYAPLPATVTQKQVKQTVHYVDIYNNVLAEAHVDTVTFTNTPGHGITQDKPEFTHPENPNFTGYHIIRDPATGNTTVAYDDADSEYTLLYAPLPAEVTQKYVTHTVHYVDVYGNTVAPDHSDTIIFTSTKEATGPITNIYSKQAYTHPAHPTIPHHHIAIDPLAGNLSIPAHITDTDTEVTVIYAPLPARVTQKQATHTFHYVDEDGNTLRPSHSDTVTFTATLDPAHNNIVYVKDKKAYTHPAHPSIDGYKISIDPLAAGLDLTAYHSDTDSEHTVVYARTKTPGGETTPPTDPGPDDPGKPTPPDKPEQPETPPTTDTKPTPPATTPELPDTDGEPAPTGKPAAVRNVNTTMKNTKRTTRTIAAAQSTKAADRQRTKQSALPQTGDRESMGIIAAGIALIVGILGIVGYSRRED